MGASAGTVPLVITPPDTAAPPGSTQPDLQPGRLQHGPVREVAGSALPWSVVSRHKGSSCAGVSIRDDSLLVFVSDTTNGANGSMATLRPDGSAVVQCLQAPQALLWTPDAHRLVPSLPGLSDDLILDDDAVLVLCSTAVLEFLPRGFGLAVSRLAQDKSTDAEILAECLSYAITGGAAIARRLPTA